MGDLGNNVGEQRKQHKIVEEVQEQIQAEGPEEKEVRSQRPSTQSSDGAQSRDRSIT